MFRAYCYLCHHCCAEWSTKFLNGYWRIVCRDCQED